MTLMQITVMRSITITGVSDALLARLEQRAAANGRDLNREVLDCLERTVMPHVTDAAERLARVDAVRVALALPYMTEAELMAAKREGR